MAFWSSEAGETAKNAETAETAKAAEANGLDKHHTKSRALCTRAEFAALGIEEGCELTCGLTGGLLFEQTRCERAYLQHKSGAVRKEERQEQQKLRKKERQDTQ